VNIREDYARDRFVLLPAFLLPEDTARLEQVTHDLPSRRVTVRSHERTEWDELDVTGRPELAAVFRMRPAAELVQTALGVSSVADRRIACWANHYREGEHIAPHRDRSGTVQLIICLRAPVSELNGGALHLSTPDGARACPLAPGDAVLWEATAIEHWTSPLVATTDDPKPERLVLVGRYFV
jgi:alkylated DNA repair dioxygenase AlkB